MSHIVQIETEVRDAVAGEAAWRRLGRKSPTPGTPQRLSAGGPGVLVEFAAWRYPIVCNPVSGKVQFDNFEGHWGELVQLHRFLQAYAVEKARLEAHKQGHSVYEQPLADGSIQLTIQVAGGAA